MKFDFSKNLGPCDRMLRVIMGTVLTALVFTKKVRGRKAALTNVLAGVMFLEAATAY